MELKIEFWESTPFGIDKEDRPNPSLSLPLPSRRSRPANGTGLRGVGHGEVVNDPQDLRFIQLRSRCSPKRTEDYRSL